MNIYDAIMKAADTIEQHPDWYDFDKNTKPDCGTPGCMLGWIGHYSGVELTASEAEFPGLYTNRTICAVGFDYSDIITESNKHFGPDLRQTQCAADAAKAMRFYAEKHFKPKGIPDSVRAIFETKEVA